jgi:ligand-binding sensor domain-containing protein
LPDNFVQVVKADDQGIIWVGTQLGGLARLDESLLSSVEAVSETASFNLFPVPAGEKLYISTKEKLMLVEVYDMTGKKVLYQTVFQKSDKMEIETAAFKSGNYLLKVVFADGSSGSRMFVVKN